MVVQHNLRAMNSNRMLGLTSSAQSKSTEKLSSGYKINRAADDAAGLAISEKMRKQIRGLTQASLNAQDGISAVQTAEGALTEVHDMLQRMNELAIKAGNGTMSEDDRQSVQEEIDQLVTEIDRVSETTKFNETYLLKGSGKNKDTEEVSARIGGKIQEATVTEARGNILSGTLDMGTPDANGIGANALDAGTEDIATIEYLDENGDKRTKDVVFETGKDAAATAKNLADAINKDDDLKHIFKASSDASGKLSIESKLDGTETDNTKNAATKITFASKMKASDPDTAGAAARFNQFATADGDGVQKAATGGAYAFDLTGLRDGESITINGKTYTYDAGKSDSNANSFKTVADLQKLLGNEYEVAVNISATKTTTTYAAQGSQPAAFDAATAEKQVVSEQVNSGVAAGSAANAIGTITTADADPSMTDNGTAGYGATVTAYTDSKVTLMIAEKATVEKASDVLNFSLQVGADTTEENKISVDIQSMSAKSLGINKVSVTGEDSTNADKAVNTIADAIAQVSKQRAALGAIQNRLEHTINNLDNVVENTTAAESQIRDTDMATEMVRYSNNNILAQAGQAMLAQSNQANQGVLSLLQ